MSQKKSVVESRVDERSKQPESKVLNEGKGNFVYHLRELRKRVLLCAYCTIISFGLTYYKLNTIILVLTKPILKYNGYNLIATSVTETFSAYVGLAIMAAIGISTPFYIWQTYLFLRPALFPSERKIAIATLLSFIGMFLSGCALLYYGILPNALHFLVGYKNPIPVQVQMQISIEGYIRLVAKVFVGFGLAMQTPLLITLLIKAGLVSPHQLKRFRRYAVVIIFVVAGIITPPDIPSQLIVGTILMFMYEIPIWVSQLIVKPKERKGT